MPSRGSKRNLLAGVGPLTPPASDDEAADDHQQKEPRLSSIRESARGSPLEEEDGTGTSAASTSRLGARGVQSLEGGGGGGGQYDDEKKDDTTNNAPPVFLPSPSRSGGGKVRQSSISSVASEAESECSITLDAIGPALAAFGGGSICTSASGAIASTRNPAQPAAATASATRSANRRARPGLLVKQKTARNVQTAKATSFVQTAGMQRATERHLAQEKKNSDPSLGGGRKSGAAGRPRSESGGSHARMMQRGRRSSGVSQASSSVGRGFGSSLNLCALVGNPDEYLEIDLCDECLHCPSLTALRQSFHESLFHGDNACSKAQDESGR
jgi:hypothetical protein